MGNSLQEEERTQTHIIQRNAAANFVGRSFNALMSLVFVPIYIRLLGAEAYGLVGFMVSLQMILSLLEMGLSTTTTKELARLSGLDHHQSERDMADLMRTLELVYLVIALFAGFIILIGSKPLAAMWFNPQVLSVGEIRHVIIIMGWLIAARMPFSLYSGALMGLQKQVLLNSIIVVLVVIKHLGAVFVLIFISSDIMVFFIWNLIAEALQTAVGGFIFWKNLKTPSYKPGFKVEQIKRIWRFAAGMSLIGATNVMLSQADKLFVSKMFSLEIFGYYSAVWTLAGALFFLTYPLVTALFPRFAQLFGKGDKHELVRLYRQSSRVLSAIMLPFGITFLFFSEQIISIWLPAVSDIQLIANVFRILVLAVMLNSLFSVPINLQLASGWTRLLICTNFVWVFALPLLMFWMVAVMGLPGVPMGWLFYNLFCFIIVSHVAHRKIFGDEMRAHFYIGDIGLPFIAVFLVISICSWLFPIPTGVIGQCIILASIVALGEIAGVLTIKDVRSKLLQTLRYGENYAK